jgi:NAD(P)-dependent dehydrogenase (short-subunit alcohol dehydrogenase family)
MASLEGKIALVTGASRGIGYHCALTLAKEGAHVIAIARTVGGLEELDDEIQANGGSTTLVPLDLTDFDAIDRLGASIHERWGKLDILVSNAGTLGDLTPVEHLEPKAFDKVMNLNVTANYRLIRSVSQLLRTSDNGRAVFMTADAADACKPFWSCYTASQTALRSMVQTWAAECQKTAMRINLLDTGPMRTAMRAQAMPGEDPETISHPSEIAQSILYLTSQKLEENGQIYDRLKASFRS